MTTQLIYGLNEAAITFQASGGSAVASFDNLATVTGRISAQYDRGASAKAAWYFWRGVYQMDSTAVVGEAAEWYLAFGDGTYVDGNVGTIDAALASVALPNLLFLGAGIVQVTTLSTDIVVSGGPILLPHRYVSAGLYNRTTKTTENTANTNKLILTPWAWQVQGAV